MRTSGVIVYNFNPDGSLAPADAGAFAKLHPSLAATVARLEDKTVSPAADEPTYVRDGKAEVRLRLKGKTPEVMSQLKQLGFEITVAATTADLLAGRLPLENLRVLAQLEAVRYVAPRRR